MVAFSNLTRATKAHLCIHLDLRTLLCFRATSKDHLELATDEFKRSLLSLARRFIPRPEQLLAALDHTSGFIGGSVAVLFLLRDRSFIPRSLDVFIPRDAWWRFEAHLLHAQNASRVGMVLPTADGDEEDNDDILQQRGLVRIAVFRTHLGIVRLFRSVAPDALVPIARSWGTHLVAYVGPGHFGHGYATLFFQRRAVLGDLLRDEAERVRAYQRRGFDIRLSPTQWSDLRLQGCGEESWICPTQPRSFDDDGALSVRMRPLQTEALESEVVWRLGGRPCGGPCLEVTDELGMEPAHRVLRVLRY
ncbi:hypothetical protein OH76DRAFT_1345253 [Lentinus brumalis]|uniref:Uncharacterized protein n=1 Tax=Lentinus brumalis TaxID=2498619 RepID=A0A371DJ96_9APHY|nr:hypothetical protein OH76DRAFT_1345253 [Polyporus brumalis]